MNRRGQIFLLLTVLVLTFLVGISTILLEVQRAKYFEPSPDSDKVLDNWDQAVDAIYSIFSTQIAVNTQAAAAPGNYDFAIDPHLNNLETYLLSNGLASTISRISSVPYTYNAPGGPVSTTSISGAVFLSISSVNGISIEQILNVNIIYTANINVANILTITKNSNGFVDYLDQSIVTGAAGITDLGSGSFQLTNAATYTVLTFDGVQIDVTL